MPSPPVTRPVAGSKPATVPADCCESDEAPDAGPDDVAGDVPGPACPPNGAGFGSGPVGPGAFALLRTPDPLARSEAVQPDCPVWRYWQGALLALTTSPKCAVPSPGATVNPPATTSG
jgi:hypothetical protein